RVDRFYVSAGDMGKQGAMGSGGRGRLGLFCVLFGGREAAGQKPDCGRLHVAFAAGDLPSKSQPWHRLEAQRVVKQFWSVEEGVAMQPAEARELCPLKAWDHAKYPGLLSVLELGLEAHHVKQRAEPVVLAQLYDGVGFYTRPVGI